MLQAPRKEGKGTSNEVRKIHVINTLFFGLQLEGFFLNLAYFDIASTFGTMIYVSFWYLLGGPLSSERLPKLFVFAKRGYSWVEMKLKPPNI